MKRVLFIFSIMFAMGAAVTAQPEGGPEIEFEKVIHDFGTLKQHGDATTEFKFTNTGTEPLIISNARGSCGCTVPEWPRKPIQPGESESIKVKYDSKRIGPINKSVTINSNAENEPTKVLRIKGKIEPAPKEEPAPVNKEKGAPVAE